MWLDLAKKFINNFYLINFMYNYQCIIDFMNEFLYLLNLFYNLVKLFKVNALHVCINTQDFFG